MFEIDPVEDLEAAISWFTEAVAEDPRRPYGPPRSARTVARQVREVEAAVAPGRVPEEVLWLWRTWDVASLRMVSDLELQDPAGSLTSWEIVTDTGPRALLPISYASHDHEFVDLTTPPGTPSILWEGGTGWVPELPATWPSLAAQVRARAELAELSGPPPADADARFDHYLGLFTRERLSAAADRAFERSGVARAVLDDHDPATWPEPWRALERGAAGPAAVGGPVARLGDVVGAAAGAGARFRVRAGWRSANSPSSGRFGLLTDDTGRLLVYLPRAVVPESLDKARLVEVDLVLPEPLGPAHQELETVSRDFEWAARHHAEQAMAGSPDHEGWRQASVTYHLAVEALAQRLPRAEAVRIAEI